MSLHTISRSARPAALSPSRVEPMDAADSYFWRHRQRAAAEARARREARAQVHG